MLRHFRMSSAFEEIEEIDSQFASPEEDEVEEDEDDDEDDDEDEDDLEDDGDLDATDDDN